jgi:hypothetical protein
VTSRNHTHYHQYRKLRTKFKADCKARNAPCWLYAHDRCQLEGQPIDYDGPPHAPRSFEPDHVIPVSIRPDLKYVVGNWAPSHARCNSSRQAKDVGDMQVVPTGPWVKPNW